LFFFEKKNQKTFARYGGAEGTATSRKGIKVFLLLFLQKKKSPYTAIPGLPRHCR
jgi:hypothetical protein